VSTTATMQVTVFFCPRDAKSINSTVRIYCPSILAYDLFFKGFGGLGVRNMVMFNKALMGKWLWRYALERDALWRKVVDFKYGSMRGGCCSKEVGSSFGFGVWKSIRRGCDAFADHVRYEIGNGSKILFWHDV
jgi:hypothetical protein